MEGNSSKLYNTFVKRNISLDANLPPSVPLVIANRSSEPNECGEDGEFVLEIVPESLELLRGVEKPVAPVAICGPYRTGKSYFLSRIVGDSDCFKVAHSTDACTQGIWMATTVLECPEFVVIFFDTEGIGAVNVSKQGSINFMISIALASSLLIYNTKRPLQFKDIEKLRWCVAMSRHFQKKDSEFQPKMPKFLWLLRDMDLNINFDSPTEWLVQKLQVPKCKEIFEALSNSFSSIECTFLPPPALRNEVLQDIVQRQDQLMPHFNLELDKSKTKILSSVEAKCCECGPFNGFSLASLIKECVAEINQQRDVLCLQRTWKVATDVQLQQYISKLIAEYEDEMSSTLEDLLPIDEGLSDTTDGNSLVKVHNQIVKIKCSLLENKVASLIPLKKIQQGVWENARRDFLSGIVERDTEGLIKGGKLAPFLHENYRLSKELCTKTYDRFYGELIASKVRCAVAEGIPYDITPDIEQFEEQYYKIACGPAKVEVFHQKRTKSKLEEKKLKQIPGNIQNLQVIGISFDRIKLTWSKPSVNPMAAHSYEIYTAKEDGSLLLAETTDKCYALIKNLKSNQRYMFVIKARNEQFVGNHVSHISIKTTLSTVARSAVGIGTFVACTVGSPILLPTILTITAISSIRDNIRQKKYGNIVGHSLLLAVAPLTIPFSATSGILAFPYIAVTALETTAPQGDLEL